MQDDQAHFQYFEPFECIAAHFSWTVENLSLVCEAKADETKGKGMAGVLTSFWFHREITKVQESLSISKSD